MENLPKTLEFLTKEIYSPNQLIIQNLAAEEQNQEYDGYVFDINSIAARYRTAKITPKKIGQFCAFWEKNAANQNQAFHYDKSPELLIINTFTETKKGQFIFPKEILCKKKILATTQQKGKMAIRVYPSWDTPTSKQAIQTQKWQLPYFIDFDAENIADRLKILNK